MSEERNQSSAAAACPTESALLDAERWQALCKMTEEGVSHGISLNMNDTFGYACADSGEAESQAELEQVVDAYIKHGWLGVLRWEVNKRGYEPIEPWRIKLEKAAI